MKKKKQTNEKEDIKPFSFSRKKKVNSFSLDSVLSMKEKLSKEVKQIKFQEPGEKQLAKCNCALEVELKINKQRYNT